MTLIFDSYAAFLTRENKEYNGVSNDFAKENPEFVKNNETNKGCWNCSDCSDCSGCFGCSGCLGCFDCSGCFGCSDCSDCFGCSDCSYCSDCFGCFDCFDCSGKQGQIYDIPVVENIHQKLLEVILDSGNSLNMLDWHTCETTHCRAGWIIHISGNAGYELARKTSNCFAAMQIYKKSSNIKVHPARFFEDNNTAMNDIKRCAELEKIG